VHNHNTDGSSILKQQINNSVKRKAQEDICERPAKLIHQEIANATQDCSDETVDMRALENIRKNIYAARRSILPPLPKNIRDVHDALNTMQVETIKNDNFLLVNDSVTNIIIFSCFTNLQFLCSVDVLYVDGTFQYCTKFFYQLYTIHGYKNGQYIPLVFALLPNKSSAVYCHMWKFILEKCGEFNLTFEPKEIFIDFEKSMHIAIRETFPLVKISGCLFHLKQAWYRKLQNLGLAKFYMDRQSEIGKWVKHIFGLPYLPPEDVGDCFLELMEVIPVSENLTKFADYLVDNYSFNPHMWADFSASTTRTTNASESFHSHFKSNFYGSHPSIYIFVKTLLSFQTFTYAKIKSAHNSRKMIRSNIRKKQDSLGNLIEHFKNGHINRVQFVNAACHFNLPL
jgi:hypothetical protein